MKMYDFLIEIGTDELPPKILKKLGIDFSNHIQNELKRNHIYYYNNTVQWFAAPRHLAVKVKIKGISNNNYNNDYNHTKQHNILLHPNINLNNITTSIHDKTQKKYPINENNLLSKKYIYDKNLKNLLLQTVNNSLKKLMNYKMMRWNNIQTPFIRPVKSIIILLNSCLIKSRFFEIKTNRISYGHRYIKKNKIIINHANEYPDILIKKGHIIIDYNERKRVIQTEIKKQAAKLGGIIDIKDNNFLEQITSSIEWPIILFGRFNKRFLSLPTEVIIHIMQEHQGYFPVYNIKNGILLPCFIFVINTIANNYKHIITGHENVLQTRFIDAEFFLKNDNKYRLEDNIPKLDSILFHNKLGSLRNKVERITELSGWIAEQINENISLAKRASYLCKCDLVTDMVLEFPKIQGIIGMYYAHRDKESEIVAIAQKEHYQPQYINDQIPTEQISCIVSIADKIDTISGIFGTEEIPTSSRDPFALKRAASGILKIIIQKKLSINLTELIDKSIRLYKSNFVHTNTIKKNIENFMHKRLYSYYYKHGYRSDIIKSVLKNQYKYIIDYTIQIHAIHNFCISHQKEYIKLHSVYKRTSNILKIQNTFVPNYIKIQSSLLIEPEEQQLFKKIVNINKKIKLLSIKKNYDIILLEIINLSNSINNFLNTVIIMDKNNDIQINRLLLIHTAQLLISKVIDLPMLHITNK